MGFGTRVMVVDGDAEMVEGIRRLLSPAGGVVTGVPSGAEALRLLPELQPDVLLVDVASGSEGFTTMERVRTLSPEQGGRVPASSLGASLLDVHRLEDWRRAGFQLHVSKPIDPEELAAVVETLTGRSIERRHRSSVVIPDRRGVPALQG